MLYFLLRRDDIDFSTTQIKVLDDPKSEFMDLSRCGSHAYPLLELRNQKGLRINLVDADIQISDTQLVEWAEDQNGFKVCRSVQAGWVELTASYGKHKCSLPVRGFDPDLAFVERRPIFPASETISLDGKLDDWDDLNYSNLKRIHSFSTKKQEDAFRFDLRYDNDFLYIAVEVTDADPHRHPNNLQPERSDHVTVVVDARPDPDRSLGRGEHPLVDHINVLMVPGESEESMLVRRSQRYWDGVLPDDVRAVSLKTKSGYISEIAIPNSYLDTFQDGPWSELRVNVSMRNWTDNKNPEDDWVTWQPAWGGLNNRIGSGTFYRSKSE